MYYLFLLRAASSRGTPRFGGGRGDINAAARRRTAKVRPRLRQVRIKVDGFGLRWDRGEHTQPRDYGGLVRYGAVLSDPEQSVKRPCSLTATR